MKKINQPQNTARLGAWMIIIGWIIVIFLVGWLYNKSLYSTQLPRIATQGNEKVLTLYREYDTHYRISGSINNVQANFLIDTGATTIAISPLLAKQAKLRLGNKISTTTANGNAIGYITRIPQLEFGPFIFNNARAIVLPGMAENDALLGMNILKNFAILQTDDQLSLTLNSTE